MEEPAEEERRYRDGDENWRPEPSRAAVGRGPAMGLLFLAWLSIPTTIPFLLFGLTSSAAIIVSIAVVALLLVSTLLGMQLGKKKAEYIAVFLFGLGLALSIVVFLARCAMAWNGR